MTADVETAALRVQHLTRLTRDLTDRLSLEMDALRAHRAQDLNEGMAQTQEMANLYRRESAQVKANPAAIAAAPEADRRALIQATEKPRDRFPKGWSAPSPPRWRAPARRASAMAPRVRPCRATAARWP
jgi:hypothetical protein